MEHDPASAPGSLHDLSAFLPSEAAGLHNAPSVLLEIGLAITSGLQMDLVLRAILDQCRRALPVDALYVALHDAANHRYEVPLFWDQGAYRSLAPVDLHQQHSLTRVVIESGQLLYLPDLSDEATQAIYQTLQVADAPTHTYLAAPMRMRGSVIGVLSIQRLQPHGYNEWHIRLLEMIAMQAAVAVENARLYEAAQSELRERQRILEALAESERRLRQANEELEQRVAERTAELQRTIGELRQANAAKDAFVAAVSYELRTPLTGVLGMAETLQAQSRGPLNEQQMHYVAIIHAGATRLQEMVNSILSYTQAVAATEPLASEPCRLADLCAISARSLRPKAERKQQRIEVEVTPPDLQIRSDAHVLVRVLDDLLDNAVKFTPEQGRVGVSVAPSPAGQAVELVVWDTGVGISAEHLTQLFKPFTQVDQRLARTYEGLGLGLAYVKRQVDRLSGAIAVESRIGEGSRFVVTLPVQPPA